MTSAPTPLGPAELVRGQRQVVDAELEHSRSKTACRLYRIGVHGKAVLPSDAPRPRLPAVERPFHCLPPAASTAPGGPETCAII